MQKKDVFGADGDFTTSPEISQVFGEVGGTLQSPLLTPHPPHSWWVCGCWLTGWQEESLETGV